MLLCDRDIRKYCSSPLFMPGGKPMIEPFCDYGDEDQQGKISYGITSGGYDLRLAPEILLFKNSFGEILDPKRFGDPDYCRRVFDDISRCDGKAKGGCGACVEAAGGKCEKAPVILPPHTYVLGRSHEYLRIPRHLKARCVGKSTWARAGVLINTTPLEPMWEGNLTIEIGNVTSSPVMLYVMEGIAQLEFEVLSSDPEVDYAQKGGKYNRQTGVTPARMPEPIREV